MKRKNGIIAFLLGYYDYIYGVKFIKTLVNIVILFSICFFWGSTCQRLIDMATGFDKNSERRYTIASPIGKRGGGHNDSEKTIFEFHYKGKRYTTEISAGTCFENYHNYKLYVHFYVSNPEKYAQINFNRIVPDWIKNGPIPTDGWKHEPQFIYRECPEYLFKQNFE